MPTWNYLIEDPKVDPKTGYRTRPRPVRLDKVGVTLLHMLWATGMQETTEYVIRHHCCGLVDIVCHRLITKRKRSKAKRCLDCGRTKRGCNSTDHPEALDAQIAGNVRVEPPNWPVPKIPPLPGWVPWHGRKPEEVQVLRCWKK